MDVEIENVCIHHNLVETKSKDDSKHHSQSEINAHTWFLPMQNIFLYPSATLIHFLFKTFLE